MEEKKPEESESLETTDNSLETPETGSSSDASAAVENAYVPPKKSGNEKIRSFISNMNVYLVLFIFMLLVAGVITLVAYLQANKESKKANTQISELTPEALEDLSGDEIKVGDPKSLLSVESNAVFSGAVLVRGSLDVAGAIKVGGALSLPGITVSGTSQFDQVQLNTLTVTGSASIQDQLNVQRGLTVSGPGNFAGPISAPSINIDRLNLSGDLQLNRHIDAGGSTPRVSSGSAVGNGGTVSVSGSDTAGTVTINVGSGAPAGVLATVSFAAAFGGVPHVVITPVGSGAAGLNWYIVSRTTTGFSIACLNAPGPGSFSFDFIAID
ncbi:MAG: hypothetical protein M3Q70_04115 [bacterium]|nr:hypothetical protein [bacterium]